MQGMLFEVSILVVLLLINGLFSMSELALVSVRKVRLKQRAEQGDQRSRAALELAEAPDDFLATVQVGITLVGIFAGAFGGASVADELAVKLAQLPAIAEYAESLALALVVLVITYLSLVIGELVPKRLALAHAEAIARAVAGPMRRLSRVAAPAVHLLNGSTRVILRLLGVKPSTEHHVTEEEVKAMIWQGRLAGVFHPAEEEMLRNVFHLADQRIARLMTARPDVVWLDLASSDEEIRELLIAQPHSRLLVCDGDIDEVAGVVRAKDLLAKCLAGEPIDLRSVLRTPLFVPETALALSVLDQIRRTGTHLAIVIDEHGGTQGLVTHHDLMEAVVGDIPEPGVASDVGAVRREDGSWLMDGWLPTDQVKRVLGLAELPDGGEGDYHTLAGMILDHLGHIPTEAERFVWNGLEFEIMDMDRHRIDKVLVRVVGS